MRNDLENDLTQLQTDMISWGIIHMSVLFSKYHRNTQQTNHFNHAFTTLFIAPCFKGPLCLLSCRVVLFYFFFNNHCYSFPLPGYSEYTMMWNLMEIKMGRLDNFTLNWVCNAKIFSKSELTECYISKLRLTQTDERVISFWISKTPKYMLSDRKFSLVFFFFLHHMSL